MSGVYVPAVQTLKSLQFPEGILSKGWFKHVFGPAESDRLDY